MAYCRYSASPVGRQLLDLHRESRETWPASDALCSALQVLNHLQDCADDYRLLDRVYLPMRDLAAEGIGVETLAARASSPRLRRVLDGTARSYRDARRRPRAACRRTSSHPDCAGNVRVIVELAARLLRRLRRGDPVGGSGQAEKIGFPRCLCSSAYCEVSADERRRIRRRSRSSRATRRCIRRSGIGSRLPEPRSIGRCVCCRSIAGTAMYAVYAFCREVDDIADGERPVEHKIAALAAWREEIDALYAGHPHHLVARALSGAGACAIVCAEQDFLAIIDGMEMDARGDMRAPDLATLDLYCARVASAVGHLSVHVFGDASDAAHAVAESLGRALQLTNILRDLGEDAGRGRLYLPREMLDRHGIRGADPRRSCGIRRCRQSAATWRRSPKLTSRKRRARWSGARAGRCDLPRSWPRSIGQRFRRCFARGGAIPRRA